MMSAQPQDSPQITNALWYASLGWSVVPAHKVVSYSDGTTGCTCPAGSRCISKGKHPAITWTHYQKERASEDQIRAWFEGPYSGYGLGIVTGAVSGIFVIDVDEGPGKPGSETINDLQMIHGDLPFTVQARTGGGGRHIIFRHPGNVWVTTAKNVLGAGVDVRGDGGFIVAAPSLHESGRFYLWDDLAHPATTPVMDAPSWVLEMAETPPPDMHGQRQSSTGTGEIIRDAWGKVIDGREKHMITIVCAVIAEKLRETGALPSVDTVVHEAWLGYERTTRARGPSLEADNRGISLMRQRTGHMLRRAAAGKWRIAGERQSSGPHPAEPPKEDPSRPTRPLILSLEEMERLPPPEWLVKGLFPERGLIVPYGPPKGGKTFIILSIGLHVAAGVDWFGHEVCQGGVVYIAGEGIGGLGIRTRAMRSRYNIPVNIPFWVIRRAVNFTTPTAAADLIKLIRDTVLDEPIAMVVIDTLARAMPGAEENSAKEVGLVIAACAEVQDALECAVVPIHHQGKDVTRGARGTSALRGAWDTAMEITTAGRRTTVTVVDQKEAESGQRLVFDLEQISVGLTRSSLVPILVTPGDGDPEGPQQDAARQRNVGGQAGVALTTLRNLMAGPESAMLPPFADIPPDTRGVQYEVWRRAFYEKMPGEEQAARRQAMKRARDELLKRNLIGVKEPWVWLV